MGMTFGGKPCQDPRKIAEYLARDTAFTIMRDWHGHANRFTCPLGDRPGRGLLLLRKQDITDLDLDNVTEFDLVVSDQIRRLVIPSLHPLRAWSITPGSDNDPNTVYAMEVADKRYYLWQSYTNAAYNVRRAPDMTADNDYIDETMNGSSTPWTWDSMGEDLWNAMGWTTSWPGWPFTPDGQPEGWHFWQVPSIEALQAVARRLGCSLRFNPFTSALDIIQLGDVDADYDSSVEAFKSRYRLWNEEWIEPWSPIVPEKVRVVFRRLLAEATGNPYETRDIDFPDTELAEFVISGTRAIVWDDLVYTGSNDTDLDNRADERADDYARIVRYFNPNDVQHYRGVGFVSDLFLGPRCSQVSWQDLGQGVQTVVESATLEAIDWSRYLHGVAEFVTSARCVGNEIEETLLTQWTGKPARVS
jgi:hypothetical protein